MKISLNWLRDYIDLDDLVSKHDVLSDLLTKAGLEVESIENRSKDFNNVVVAHILELKKHPDADRLTLCQVSTGQGVVHQIVCGATNHKQGDRVVAALPGAILPGNFAIKLSKIRGVESQGMLCSEKELGLAGDQNGIMILPEDAPLGEPFAKYMGFDDVIFELKVTPNRADCLSHLGLARELGTLLGKEYKLPQHNIESGYEASVSSSSHEVELIVKSGELCPRYCGRVVRHVKIDSSPRWLKQRLESVGLKSINNVVDVTNYVMMELGQPLHAFDLEKILGKKISIEMARPGEVFSTLDGTELSLDGSELMIRDSERSVALAGVIGGKSSGVSESTKDLFVESAFFKPSSVRRTARKFGIETDASYRFSRGVDPELAKIALDRACFLIQEVCGGRPATSDQDVYLNPVRQDQILITTSDISERLGYPVSAERLAAIFESLGCQSSQLGSGEFQVRPPSYRGDLKEQIDLVEEVARLNGYELIGETLPEESLFPTAHQPRYFQTQRICEEFSREGYSEVVNFNFLNSKFQNTLLGPLVDFKVTGLEVSGDVVRLVNPLNEDFDVMRVSMIPMLLKNVSHNSRHGNQAGRLFESGFTFFGNSEGFVEDWRVGLAAWGTYSDLWIKDSMEPLVLEVKSSVENVLRGIGCRSWKWDIKPQLPQFLHPGQSAVLTVEGRLLGYIGRLHPKVQDWVDIVPQTVVAEFSLEKLMLGQPRIPKAHAPSKYPVVERDLAFVVPRSMSSATLLAEVKKSAGALLQKIDIFDVFEDEKIGIDLKSIALRLQFQDQQSTITEEQAHKVHADVIDQVCHRLGVRIR